MDYNTTQHPPPPHRHTLSVYTVRLLWEEGGGGGGQREGRGATVCEERVKRKLYSTILTFYLFSNHYSKSFDI